MVLISCDLFLKMIHIYIYIYIERERERDHKSFMRWPHLYLKKMATMNSSWSWFIWHPPPLLPLFDFSPSSFLSLLFLFRCSHTLKISTEIYFGGMRWKQDCVGKHWLFSFTPHQVWLKHQPGPAPERPAPRWSSAGPWAPVQVNPNKHRCSQFSSVRNRLTSRLSTRNKWEGTGMPDCLFYVQEWFHGVHLSQPWVPLPIFKPETSTLRSISQEVIIAEALTLPLNHDTTQQSTCVCMLCTCLVELVVLIDMLKSWKISSTFLPGFKIW